MTFRAERYPAGWRKISLAIRERAGQTCECIGECGGPHDGGRCDAPNGELVERDARTPSRWRHHHHNGVCMGEPCGAVKIVLTVAHVDHDETHNDPSNLRALCQRCHLKLDAADNLARKRERRAAADGQNPLPLLATMPEHRGRA